MSTKPHTPGPWFAHENEDREFGLYSVCSESFGTCLVEVAEIRLCEAGDMEPDGSGGSREFRSYKTDEEECAANARLIAAAPELLAALRQTLDALYNETHGDRSPWIESVIAAANAAIAKATGEGQP